MDVGVVELRDTHSCKYAPRSRVLINVRTDLLLTDRLTRRAQNRITSPGLLLLSKGGLVLASASDLFFSSLNREATSDERLATSRK